VHLVAKWPSCTKPQGVEPVVEDVEKLKLLKSEEMTR
jgi:hypothetical protein